MTTKEVPRLSKKAESMKATTERAAVRRWEAGGKKGRKPATPYSDLLVADANAPKATPAPRQARAPRAPGATAPAAPSVIYFHDGEQVGPTVNRFSAVAYFYSKGIDGPKHVGAARFAEILTGLGVEDPRGTFDVILPNGHRLTATAPGGSVPKKAPTAKAPAKSTKKVAAPAAKKSAPASVAARRQAPTSGKVTRKVA